MNKNSEKLIVVGSGISGIMTAWQAALQYEKLVEINLHFHFE